jgi:amino acid permease
MISFDKLPKKKKEKFNAYMKTRMIFTIRFYVLMLICAILLTCGIILVSVNSIYAFFLGIYLIIASSLVCLMMYQSYDNERKLSTLVFDIDNAQEDVFEVTDEDLKKMKKRWIKVK